MGEFVNDILNKCDDYNGSSYVSGSEEDRLRTMIRNTFPNVKIAKIQKLSNKFLYSSFMLKKCEKKNYRVVELIHATAAKHIPSIEKTNLNWRLVYRNKYGTGVSFSDDADYANFFSSRDNGSRRAFIICDVLMDNVHTVDEDSSDEIPHDDGIDTYMSDTKYVFVKFDDFVFYPKYALIYNVPARRTSKFYYDRPTAPSYDFDFDDYSD